MVSSESEKGPFYGITDVRTQLDLLLAVSPHRKLAMKASEQVHPSPQRLYRTRLSDEQLVVGHVAQWPAIGWSATATSAQFQRQVRSRGSVRTYSKDRTTTVRKTTKYAAPASEATVYAGSRPSSIGGNRPHLAVESHTNKAANDDQYHASYCSQKYSDITPVQVRPWVLLQERYSHSSTVPAHRQMYKRSRQAAYAPVTIIADSELRQVAAGSLHSSKWDAQQFASHTAAMLVQKQLLRPGSKLAPAAALLLLAPEVAAAQISKQYNLSEQLPCQQATDITVMNAAAPTADGHAAATAAMPAAPLSEHDQPQVAAPVAAISAKAANAVLLPQYIATHGLHAVSGAGSTWALYESREVCKHGRNETPSSNCSTVTVPANESVGGNKWLAKGRALATNKNHGTAACKAADRPGKQPAQQEQQLQPDQACQVAEAADMSVGHNVCPDSTTPNANSNSANTPAAVTGSLQVYHYPMHGSKPNASVQATKPRAALADAATASQRIHRADTSAIDSESRANGLNSSGAVADALVSHQHQLVKLAVQRQQEAWHHNGQQQQPDEQMQQPDAASADHSATAAAQGIEPWVSATFAEVARDNNFPDSPSTAVADHDWAVIPHGVLPTEPSSTAAAAAGDAPGILEECASEGSSWCCSDELMLEMQHRPGTEVHGHPYASDNSEDEWQQV